MPPQLMPFGDKNKSKPRANMALPNTISAYLRASPKTLYFKYAPSHGFYPDISIKTVFCKSGRISKRTYYNPSIAICFSSLSSSFNSAPAAGMVRVR